MNIVIRNERKEDFEEVENLIRKSFYNLYIPGCFEHYLAHTIRSHEDFVHELDFVMELDGKIIGNIMYTKTKLVNEEGKIKNILTFGPVCISPEYQRKGYGKKLLEHSFEKARELGYKAIVIFGAPANYVGVGFKSCKKYNVSLENDIFPTAMMIKELKEKSLDGKKWTYYQSSAFEINEKEAEKFDENFGKSGKFEKLEKKYLPCQEEFYILSNSKIV